MASKKQTRPLPEGVPAENEYHSLHWSVILTYLVAAGGLYLLLFSAD